MTHFGAFPKTRLRRLRQNEALRSLIRETRLDLDKLVLPLFIRHGEGKKIPIASMPGHYQLSIDCLEEELQTLQKLGINKLMLFGIPEHKDALGQDAYSANGIIQSAIPVIKKANPDFLVFSDVCFCEYTDHGHCGVIDHKEEHFNVNNDQTLALLAKQAVSHAQAGADVLAPSGMMDGVVEALRNALDHAGYHNIPILCHSTKYCSSLYAPFRDAAEGAPQFGNRRGYQMDIANSNEAMRECGLDIAEGADMLMIKPAHAYLDIIFRVKQAYPELPLGAYHVSGEYAMIKAAAEKGWIDEKNVALEILTAIHRAGADFIITYYAKEVATWQI